MSKQSSKDVKQEALLAQVHSAREMRIDEIVAHGKRLEKPIIASLQEHSFSCSSLDELRNGGVSYERAVPVLIDWLRRLRKNTSLTDLRTDLVGFAELGLRESLVRTLSVPWARPTAIPVLLEEFEAANNENGRIDDYYLTNYLWVVGNALWVLADPKFEDAYIAIVQNRKFSWARGCLVEALPKFKSEKSIDVMMEVLAEPFGDANTTSIPMYAAIGLGKRKVLRALPAIRDLHARMDAALGRDERWMLKKVAKVIESLEKYQASVH